MISNDDPGVKSTTLSLLPETKASNERFHVRRKTDLDIFVFRLGAPPASQVKHATPPQHDDMHTAFLDEGELKSGARRTKVRNASLVVRFAQISPAAGDD